MSTKSLPRHTLAPGLVMAAVLLTSCGAQDVVGGPVARSGAAQAGKYAFKQAGHEIDGELSCSTDEKGDDEMKVACTGTTKDGKPARLNAVLEKDAKVVTGDGARIQGATVTGTVGGEEVFKKECIGQGC